LPISEKSCLSEKKLDIENLLKIVDTYYSEMKDLAFLGIGPESNRKIFLEQAFANFSDPNFGSSFAGPCGIRGIRQITGEIFRNQANSHRHGQNKPKIFFLKTLKNSISQARVRGWVHIFG
jgi:hypothetical protein